MKYYVVYMYIDKDKGACLASEIICMDGFETEDDIKEAQAQLSHEDALIINWKLLA